MTTVFNEIFSTLPYMCFACNLSSYTGVLVEAHFLKISFFYKSNIYSDKYGQVHVNLRVVAMFVLIIYVYIHT